MLEPTPGRAVFAFAVNPDWCEEPDQVLAWLDPGKVTSYWDIAPYFEEDGGVHVRNIDLELIGTAHG